MTGVRVCVYCRRHQIDPAWRPFCSERCKMADLGRWLTGDYRVPGASAVHSDDPDHPGQDDEETDDV